MTRRQLTPATIELVAERFRALGEPARLHIMNALRAGERTVGELVEATGLGTANVSKHLHLLHAAGFVTRRKEGLFVHYGLAGEDVWSQGVVAPRIGWRQPTAPARSVRRAAAEYSAASAD
jgi:ArsR family transcriptional regulator